MPWRVRGRLVSWANFSVCIQPVLTDPVPSPRRALRPDAPVVCSGFGFDRLNCQTPPKLDHMYSAFLSNIRNVPDLLICLTLSRECIACPGMTPRKHMRLLMGSATSRSNRLGLKIRAHSWTCFTKRVRLQLLLPRLPNRRSCFCASTSVTKSRLRTARASRIATIGTSSIRLGKPIKTLWLTRARQREKPGKYNEKGRTRLEKSQHLSVF